jgi:hypothetical protein
MTNVEMTGLFSSGEAVFCCCGFASIDTLNIAVFRLPDVDWIRYVHWHDA